MQQRYFAAYHRDEIVRKNSSSGGAFTAISDLWFDTHNNAVVYGCEMNENLEAVHKRAVTKEERNKMRGSKYISSDCSGIYAMVAEDLNNNNMVLFSGTPCQIAALKKYIVNRCSHLINNLLTVEVICHGVAEKSVFDDYISYMERKYKGKAMSCKFRAKNKPRKKQDMEIEFSNGKKYNAATTRYDWFYSLYLRNLILKQACYSCKFACERRIADITVGDLWEDNKCDLIDKSLILFNSLQGTRLIGELSKVMYMQELSREQIYNQPCLEKPSSKPDNYDEFWELYKNNGFMAAQKYVGNNTLIGMLKYYCAVIADKMNLRQIVINFRR